MNLPPTLAQIASCVSGYDPNALPVAAAQAFIAQLVPRVSTIEQVALRTSLGRVLAKDIVSAINVPSHDNSAMDGYALRGSDLAASGETLLKVAGTGFAGQAYAGAVPAGHCVRIMTGAVMPAGLDTVVPQELTQLEADAVRIPAGVVRTGDNRRLAGEDLARGSAALRAGRLLRPADLGLLASLGQAEVPVFRKLRVAFFSTGDELRSIGEPLDEGCVYDSNRYTLWAMLQRLGCEVLDLGVVRDDPLALRAAFSEAAANADAVITSGGVSVGEADHTKQIMAELGDVLFWRIAMRPGRPMVVGRIGTPARRRGPRQRRDPVRPARQPGGRDGHLLRLRARRAARDEWRVARAATVAACRLHHRLAQEAGPHRVPARHRHAQRRWPLAGGHHRQPGLGHLVEHEPGQRHGGVAPRPGQCGGGR